ncbi:S4 domain-containing protein [Methylobacterium oryzae CBMB20]
MARAGIASRRDAETMILAGRVSVNGETLTSPARNVTENDRILIDGEAMPSRERSRLWIFHKPRGVVTTARDPEGPADGVRRAPGGSAPGRGGRTARHQHRGAAAAHQ